MIGYLYAIFSMFGFSINQIFNKKLTLKLDSFNSFLARELYLVLLLILLSISIGDFSAISLQSFFVVLIGGLVGTISYIYLLKSFSHIPLGIAMTIANIAPFFTLLLSIFFYSQYITLNQFLTMLVVLLGIFITVLQTSKFKVKQYKYLFFPFVTAIGWGIYFFCTYHLSRQNINPFNISLYVEFTSLILLSIYMLFKNNIDKQILDKSNFQFGFLTGLFSLIGLVSSIYAMQSIKPAITLSIISAQIILITIFSQFLFKEKLNIRQWIGIFIVFVGLVLFNFI